MRFDSFHPAINFLFFGVTVCVAVLFNQPVFLAIGYVCAFVYSVYLSGKKALIFNVALIIFICLFTLFYSGYHHFGVTDLGINPIGNHITLEAVITGLVIGGTAATVFMWGSCMCAVISGDKVIYLFGRISPRFSLFFSILLRMVPRIAGKARQMNMAQTAVGRGIGQGNILQRIHNFFRIASILWTWVSESLIETSDSMRCRGYTLKGRTAFSIYRFDYRDRGMVLTMVCGIAIMLAGILLDQTHILYNPEIRINRITPLSFLFYFVYGLFCLFPLLVQAIGEWNFRKKHK
ncbi:MAG: energy-coupling factor transporter transmembrane component T [Christensenella sp.]|nr:energy-coupling factor transporter transmembrane component T [Christensenella sp.]